MWEAPGLAWQLWLAEATAGLRAYLHHIYLYKYLITSYKIYYLCNINYKNNIYISYVMVPNTVISTASNSLRSPISAKSSCSLHAAAAYGDWLRLGRAPPPLDSASFQLLGL